ncbi:uncharacterized protein N7469_005362 [Penicillium citrinum]|uniref:Zn(2)-C6 fungal-type domain-containing protein n=1 Tax=Penicillium citrinum TaxID=5077 RepID=A0A9W9P190_PENCI|nr:uncharacterized protein N7469_005362 [Penicillium citrinum]KAJ5233596.1 hypothetical protein N7469_005362 [Penicillium citrinum]KAK5790392.1 hypothetical protein VI817_007679 [Penicillium citrinum]
MAQSNAPRKEAESSKIISNKRSCTRCNQKKVKCNRRSPCNHCVKAKETCIFPGDKRAPRQLNRPPVSELLARLKELEAEVDQLRSKESDPLLTEESAPKSNELPESLAFNGFSLPGPSRNFTNGWSSREFRHHHLQPEQIKKLWTVHQENVAPLIAILHIPSTQKIISDAIEGVELDAVHDALVLAVCFSAIVSLTPAQCQTILDRDHHTARRNYEIAFGRTLDSAGFLNPKNILIIQAAVLFLLCSRAGGNTRLVWARTAVVIRLAQSLQIHTDGEELKLSPFETEIRRRLWWYICILDMLSSEDQAMDTQIRPGMFNTKYPSNINGKDLSPGMVAEPTGRVVFTDITHCILSSKVLNEIYWSRPLLDRSLTTSFSDQEDAVTRVGKNLQDEYLSYYNLDIPLQWISATIIRLQLSRAWLLSRIPSEPLLGSNQPHNDTAFETAVECINFSYLLQTNTVTAQWSWLCKSYKQWQIMAYLLAELSNRPLSAETDHAWDVVTKMLLQWQQNAQNDTAFEKPFTELVERAAAVRAAKLAVQSVPQDEPVRDPGENPFGILELGLSIDWLREAGI